jgi:hypothetical protein
MLHRIKPSRRECSFHLTYKHLNLLLHPLQHHLWDLLSTNLSIDVTEFSKHIPKISFKIATEQYRHESLYENMVVVTFQSIEFTSAYTNCSFYVCPITVEKLQCLKPPKYISPFRRLQTAWRLWSPQFPPCFRFSLQRRTTIESS